MSDLSLIIEPAELEAQLGNPQLLIVDVSSEESYLSGHIPGAIHLAPQSLMSGEAPALGRLPSAERLNQLFSAIGLSADSHLVVYDNEGGGWAGRLIWTLDVIGHRHYSYLNGGVHAWKGEGRTLETQPSTPTASQVSVTINTAVIAEIDDILADLGKPDFAIWDARGPQEYSGERKFALKGGHIPGAINCEWTALMDPQRGLRIRTDAEQRLAALGLTRDKRMVTHCQSHHRSGFTYLVGKSLGFDIRAYHGSWSEWGNHPDTPVEQ